jgi:hypothetical protein
MTIEIGIPEETAAAAPAPPVEAEAVRIPLHERTSALFLAFLLVGAVVLAACLFSVHKRTAEELMRHGGSVRSQTVLKHWLDEGYFHYAGMLNRSADTTQIYKNSTGGFMISGFLVEKVFSTISGRYSYRLLALHNQFVSMVLCALAGLLSYRIARRFDLEPRLAFASGAAVVIVLFTFPDNLDLYWEMSPQAYSLLFGLLYLVLEERSIDRVPRPRAFLIAQALCVFVMTVMESIIALAFVASVAATIVILRRDASWRRLLLVLVVPSLSAFGLYHVQLKIATARFPDAPTTGSKMLWRTGLDGEATYYGDHLDIAKRRDAVRANWKPNGQYLFRWKWVFLLGIASTIAVLIAFLRGRAPRIALESLVALTGIWLLYAAIFSQAVVIHPYLYDVLLFTPLCIALFALAPALLESLTRRTGAIVLVIVFGAFWYALFQMRLYALRWPLPPPAAAATAAKS